MKNGKRAVFIIPVKHSSAVRDDCCTRVRAEERWGLGWGWGGGARTLHPVQSYSIWRTRGCVVASEAARMCACAHLSACVHELFVSPPQALGCRLGMQP